MVYELSAGIQPHWDNLTLFLYVLVGCCAAMLASASRRASMSMDGSFYSKFALVASCTVLVLFKAGSVGATDVKNGYYYNFTTAGSLSSYYDQTTEFAHRLLMVICRNITEDYRFYLFVVALLTIIPVYIALWIARDRISLPASVLAFSLVFMPMGMSALRTALAASLVFLSAVLYCRNQKIHSFVLFLIALLFHRGALIALLFLVLWELRVYKVYMIILAVLLTALAVLGVGFASVLLQGRYSIYDVNLEMQGSGLGVIVKWGSLFICALACLIVMRKNDDHAVLFEDMEMVDCGLLFSFVGAELEFLNYFVSIVGRLEIFVLPVILFIGYLWQAQNSKTIGGVAVKVLLFVYMIGMLYMRMRDCAISEALMPYVWAF